MIHMTICNYNTKELLFDTSRFWASGLGPCLHRKNVELFLYQLHWDTDLHLCHQTNAFHTVSLMEASEIWGCWWQDVQITQTQIRIPFGCHRARRSQPGSEWQLVLCKKMRQKGEMPLPIQLPDVTFPKARASVAAKGLYDWDLFPLNVEEKSGATGVERNTQRRLVELGHPETLHRVLEC